MIIPYCVRVMYIVMYNIIQTVCILINWHFKFRKEIIIMYLYVDFNFVISTGIKMETVNLNFKPLFINVHMYIGIYYIILTPSY